MTEIETVSSSGYILEASYVILIESIIFTGTFAGICLIISPSIFVILMPSTVLVMCTLAILFNTFAIILIHSGLHGSETKKILHLRFQPNSLILGMLQAVLHTLVVFFLNLLLFVIIYWVFSAHEINIIFFVANKLPRQKLDWMLRLTTIGTLCANTVMLGLFTILFVTLRNALGNLESCPAQFYGLVETWVAFLLWFQYFREQCLSDVCINQNECNLDDIELFSSRDLSLLQVAVLVCSVFFMLDIISAKAHSTLSSVWSTVWFLILVCCRLLTTLGVFMIYIIFIENEISELRIVNLGSLLTFSVTVILEILYCYFSIYRQHNQRSKNEQKGNPTT